MAVARAEVPDLIVSDVMMPIMNGLEFCQQVKSDIVTSHIPVILLTARALNQHQIEGYESGADAYITKPFSTPLLLARIDNLLRNRHRLKDLWGSNKAEEEKTPKSKPIEQPAAVQEPGDEGKENLFITRIKEILETRMADSDLSVETIGADIGLSRVQLYRKVKALTGYTPVDLLRKARLEKARQMLLTTDLSVSEVAYKVGFTSPSYFSKCFKDEYGIVPGVARS
jgi:YesN/AraC family two-component response regulator